MENEQNKSTTPGTIILIALVIIICIVALVIWKSAHGTIPNPNTSGAAVAQSIPVPTIKTTLVNVSLTDTGYSPAVVTIHSGDRIIFTNNSQNRMWTASDPHPQHTAYPGFDEKSAGVSGAQYSFTFTTIGHWGYHNHLNPRQKGTVIVK
jgi:plastocyanin